MLDSYIEGLKLTLASKKMISLIYLTTFFGALILVIPFFNTVSSEMTDSLLINKLLEGFDYTAFSEIDRNFEELISMVVSIIKWLGVGYFFFSIALAGGIIKTLLSKDLIFNFKIFVSACVENFWRLFRVTFYNLVIQLVLFIGMILPAVTIVKSVSDVAESEASIVFTVSIIAFIHLNVVAFFALVADYAKIILVNENSKKVIESGYKAFLFVLNNFKSYFLYLMTMIFPAALILIYWLIEAKIPMNNFSTILLMFIIQQVFVWTRLAAKIWVIGSQVSFLKPKEIKQEVVDEEKFTEEKIYEPEMIKEIIID